MSSFPLSWLLTLASLTPASPSIHRAATAGDIIDNGHIQLGVHQEGHLNIPGPPSSQTNTPVVGMRQMSNNLENTGCGALFEGWGAADALSNTSGWANEAWGGTNGLTLESYWASSSEAESVVNVGGVLRVTHHYFPSTHSCLPLYQCDITIENISNTTTEILYRRVTDWDVEPTAFNEYILIQGTTTTPEIEYANDNGFASPDPLATLPPFLQAENDFNFVGPDNLGAFFHMNLGLHEPGESAHFRMYYGHEYYFPAVNNALQEIGADAYCVAAHGAVSSIGFPFQAFVFPDVPCLPPAEPFQFLDTFKKDLFENDGAWDVAVYHPCQPNPANWFHLQGLASGAVLVTDPAAQKILRFGGDGLSNLPIFEFPSPPFWPWMLGPLGIAVNDIPEHVNIGQVYVTDHDGTGFGLLRQFQINGCFSGGFVVDTSGIYPTSFVEPLGVAVDRAGHVYVADRGLGVVLRFPESEFTTSCLGLGGAILPDAVYEVRDDGYPDPIDVSVDVAGRVHVTYDDGSGNAGVVVYDSSGTVLGPVTTRAHGIDARLPLADTWFSADATLENMEWQDLPSGTWELSDPLLDLTWTLWRNGLETQSWWNFELGPVNAPRKTRCRERLFSAGTLEIGVWGRDFLSTRLPKQCKLWLPLDESGTIVHQNLVRPAKPGTRFGAPLPRPNEGMVRCALEFDGSGAGVRVPSYPEIALDEAGSTTIEGWIRAEPSPPGVQTFLDKRDSSGFGYRLILDNGRLGIEIVDDTLQKFTFVPSNPDAFVADGRWHHFAVVHHGAGISLGGPCVVLYVDGISAVGMGTQNWNFGSYYDNGSDLYVGCAAPGTGSTSFTGALDEITLYQRGLIPRDVERIACAYAAGKHRPAVQSTPLLKK